MKTLQFYETTIFSASSPHGAHMMVVPGRSVPARAKKPVSRAVLMKQLGLTWKGEVKPKDLALELAMICSSKRQPTNLIAAGGLALAPPATRATIKTSLEPRDIEFGKALAMRRLVPFESSPLAAKQLLSLVTQATGAGIGAFAGFVVFGASPLLFIAVPAGMILFGAAAGAGQGLEEGLRTRVRNWIAGDRARPASKKKSRKKAGKSA